MRARGATLVEYAVILTVTIFMVGAAYKGLGAKVAARARQAATAVSAGSGAGCDSTSDAPMAPLMTAPPSRSTNVHNMRVNPTGPTNPGTAPPLPGGGGAGAGGSPSAPPSQESAPSPTQPTPEDVSNQIERQTQMINDMSEMLHREHERSMDAIGDMS